MEVSAMERKLGLERGWGNGYVCLPEGHPLYGKHYNKIDNLSVHGGLTFCGRSKDYNWADMPNAIRGCNYWLLGFDTSHYNDNQSNCPKSYVLRETRMLAEQIEKLYPYEK